MVDYNASASAVAGAGAGAGAGASAGVAVLNSGSIFTSTMEKEPPQTIYQTHLRGSFQDSSTPSHLVIRLSDAALETVTAAARRGVSVDECIFGAIRRFDYKELEILDETSMTMLGLRLPQATFAFDFRPSAGTIEVLVHRKELPVSKSFGGAPFVFVFYLPNVGEGGGEIVVTRSFVVASKEPNERARQPRPAPKRVRGPPPRRPFASAPTEEEAAINMLLGISAPAASVSAAMPSSTPAVSESSAGEGVVSESGSPAEEVSRACKRARFAAFPASAAAVSVGEADLEAEADREGSPDHEGEDELDVVTASTPSIMLPMAPVGFPAHSINMAQLTRDFAEPTEAEVEAAFAASCSSPLLSAMSPFGAAVAEVAAHEEIPSPFVSAHGGVGGASPTSGVTVDGNEQAHDEHADSPLASFSTSDDAFMSLFGSTSPASYIYAPVPTSVISHAVSI